MIEEPIELLLGQAVPSRKPFPAALGPHGAFPPYDTVKRFLLFDLTLSPHIDYLPLEVCTLNDNLTPEQTRGVVELKNNRITGIEPIGPPDNQSRFGIGGAALGPFSGKLVGELHAIGNYIDNRNVPFMQGDDSGIAMAAASFSFLEYRDNRLYTDGESVEIEGLANPDATIEVVGNDISNDGAVLSLADLTEIVGLTTGVSGGHPAALKVIGVQAKNVLIQGNTIAVSGYPSAVCIMAGADAFRPLEDICFEILTSFEATENGLVFWDSTFDNLFFGDTGGSVVDQGMNNRINP